MSTHRTLAKAFAGLLITGTIAIGAAAPAQAKDTGWNGTVAPAHSSTTTTPQQSDDTGWNGT